MQKSDPKVPAARPQPRRPSPIVDPARRAAPASEARVPAMSQGVSQPRVPVAAAPAASQARVPAVSQPRVAVISQPRAPVARAAANQPRSPEVREAAPEAPRAPQRTYVAVPVAERVSAENIQPLQTGFFESIAQVQALTLMSRDAIRDVEPRSLNELRGYAREDLLAIAEIAYHYLMNGGVKLALVLFEGLAAVSPREPYFALGTGLAHDHAGNKKDALAWYEVAGRLDPSDPRPDINRAELFIEGKDRRRAAELLIAAARKASAKHDEALLRKATAILTLIKPAA